MAHKFQIGQVVEYHPPRGIDAPRGTYLVAALLPDEMENSITTSGIRAKCIDNPKIDLRSSPILNVGIAGTDRLDEIHQCVRQRSIGTRELI